MVFLIIPAEISLHLRIYRNTEKTLHIKVGTIMLTSMEITNTTMVFPMITGVAIMPW